MADLSLFVRVTDLTFGGPQPAVSLERYYNQDGATGGPVGNRWSFNLGETLTADADSSLVLHRGTGRNDRFALSAGAGGWFTVTGTADSLTRNADGSSVVASPGGTTRTFTADGRLAAIKDGTATRAVLDYDATGRLSAVRSRGRSLRISWNGDGRVASVSDTAGRSVSNTYSADGNLTQQTNADGSTVSYRYNDAGLLTSIAWNGGTATITYNTDDIYTSVSAVTQPDGAKRIYDVPRSPREIRVTD